MPVAKKTFLGLALLALLLVPAMADAYSVRKVNGKYVRWPVNYIFFQVNTDGMPSNGLTAILEGMATWSNAGANLTMYYDGATTSHDYGSKDNANIVDVGSITSSSTIAQCTTWYSTSTGNILDTDIRLNESKTWATDGRSSAYDVQNIVTHELGHTLKLLDLYGSGDSNKTMYGYGSKGETKKRDLDPDDIDGIKSLY